MSKNFFIELSEYHSWANNRVCDWLEHISAEQWNQPVVSSFQSIYETILHMAGAEKTWLERMKKQPNSQMLAATFKGSKDELIEIWKATSAGYQKFIMAMPEDQFQQILNYKNLKGKEFNEPFYQLLAHVFNHATYHRGQVVTMLRQVGYTDFSSTDMTTFFRLKNEFATQVFSN